MKSKYTDVLIIGGGPAGLSAAISCKKAFPSYSVRLIEKTIPFNKIGCVLRNQTIEYLSILDVRRSDLGEICKIEGNNLYSIQRKYLEIALTKKAINYGVEIISDSVTEVKGAESSIESVTLKGKGVLHAGFYIDATGQAAIIPRSLGLRKRSGPDYKAVYTHIFTNELIEPIKNKPTNNGFLWLIPLPNDYGNEGFKYQLLQVLKEGSDVITDRNLLDSTPELIELGIDSKAVILDPCSVFQRYVRQHPPFIYENRLSNGKNWIAIGDADSTYFDKIFAGIDKGILDGLEMPKSI